MSATPTPRQPDGRSAWTFLDNTPGIGIEDDHSPFVPDGIEPCQFADLRGVGGEQRYSPEHRLWMEVMNDAIRCLRGVAKYSTYNGTLSYSRQLHINARIWFEDLESYGPGSLRWICDQFGLDAAEVSKAVLANRGTTPRKEAADHSSMRHPVATYQRRTHQGHRIDRPSKVAP